MKIFNFFLLLLLFAACNGNNESNVEDQQENQQEEKIVNVYTHRHYEVDQQLFSEFEKETGIKVNVVKASADELIVRLENEGKNSPADLLVTVDAGRLHLAREKGLFQPISSDILSNNIPSHLRDPEGHWFGQTMRSRIIAYSKERVDPSRLSTYMDLTDDSWKGKILVRSSENIYNQSLMASIIAHHGEEAAKEWAEKMVENMAREPKGSDRDQVIAVYAGQGDLALVNSYYIGALLNSDNQEEVKAGESIGVFFPNQETTGAHINISGAGVTRYAPNKENAIQLLEFLSEKKAQEMFAQANFEYPVNPEVEIAPLLQQWGDFRADTLQLSELGRLNVQAVRIFNEVNWK